MIEQMSIFDAMPRIKNTEDSAFTSTRKMQVLSLFSGIGAFEKALDNLEIEYDLVGFCEIDKYAAKSYCAIHGVDESKNLGDITKVDEANLPKDIDLLTYGFPCQDISSAGLMRGLFNEDGTQTRSGLFFEALRIIESTKPKIAIAENVKALTGKRFTTQFRLVLASIESAGYNNYWAVLNARDYGVPQNRERVFIVSIRKDIDHGSFEFPHSFPLKKKLKDVLEEMVDESYYLSFQATKHITGVVPGETVTLTRKGNVNKVEIANTLTARNPTTSWGNYTPITAVAVAVRGRYDEFGNVQQQLEVSDHEYANAITTVQKDSMVFDGQRFRKLTANEYFRLMGFDDTDFAKAEAVNSNTQLYKQAGNSIVVQVIEHIFKALLM